MASEKTSVIKYLFFKHWDRRRRRLSKSIMSFADVQDAIRYCNAELGLNLSDRNPANFMKDVVRGRGASRNWPPEVTALRFTAIQRPGGGNVFEFIPFEADQTEPFPDSFSPNSETPIIKIQSVSLPLAAKELGRSDEPWLIQTAVNLRVIETHFAAVSEIPVVQLTHLQMSLKLRRTEIDAMFLAICKTADGEKRAIITCEAKQARERILEHQIVNQAKAAFDETNVDLVIPIALQAIKTVGFYIVEFRAVARAEADELTSLSVAKDALYQLVPPVPGI